MSRLSQIAPPGATAPIQNRMGSFGFGWDRWTVAAWAIAALASLPTLAILASLFDTSEGALGHLAGTVLPQYILNTGGLMLLSGLLAILIGVSTAWLVAATEFPGRRILAWMLVLPLAVPAYISAYIYADLLDFSGPVQSGLRGVTGWNVGDYAFPQIRSLPGAALIFAITLYPYAYLLARAAFAKQSVRQFRAARTLGATPRQAFWRIALPGARPAIAGGMALVFMEVLADFGVAEYFAIPTFSTGIFRSWLAMGDKQAALQLAAVMLVFVVALIALEASGRKGRQDSADGHVEGTALVELTGVGKALAVLACAVPVVLGFVVPTLHLTGLSLEIGDQLRAATLWSYASDSLWLGLATAGLTVVLALILTFAKRRSDSRITKAAIRVSTLGYALPGALLAVGLLAPLGVLDVSLTRFSRDTFGLDHSLLLTGTSAILIYALSVRFLTVAYNSADGGMAKIPLSLDAAARSLGATPSKVLRRIHIPLLSPSLAAAAALVFIDTLRELPATLILRPFNLETLATRVYRLASDEKLAEASTAALMILAAGLIPVLLLNRASKR